MSKIVWDQVGERFFETGVDHGVLYPYDNGSYQAGVAWNGLTNVSENPSGADNNDFWADNLKYVSLRSAEEFGASIECYTYPDEFAECNGERALANGVTIGQQKRKSFGFSYRTKLGNDVDGDDHGYKLHLIYGCTAAPTEKSYQTINDSPDIITFSYEINTIPVAIPGYDKPSAQITIDSTKINHTKLMKIENALYGTENGSPTLPMPADIIAILNAEEIVMSADPSSIEVAVGDTSEAVSITITPTQTPAPTIVWTSADTSIATVSAGAITGVAAGITTVTATVVIDDITYNAVVSVEVTGGQG